MQIPFFILLGYWCPFRHTFETLVPVSSYFWDISAPAIILWGHWCSCPFVRVKGRYALIYGRQGHQCPKRMTEGICIPFTVVRGYICPFFLLTNQERTKIKILLYPYLNFLEISSFNSSFLKGKKFKYVIELSKNVHLCHQLKVLLIYIITIKEKVHSCHHF